MTKNNLEFSAGEAKIFIAGPAGKIETLTATPTETSKNIVAIVCHPHPLFGGTMHNKVAYTLARAFKDLGLRTVRFNFRGVGHSEGSYGEGSAETEDLQAIMRWVQQTRPQDAIWLAGFSFGSYVATRAAAVSEVSQLVTVAPPVESFDFTELATPSCPWLVVQGEEDEIVAPQAVYRWHATVQPTPRLIRIPKAGHFFHGQLIELREVLTTALVDQVAL